MWSGRLPLSAIAKAKALSAKDAADNARFASQADAIAAALAAFKPPGETPP